MAITTIGGNINSTAVLANLDYKYGPYNSLQEAYDTLGPNGVDKLAIGLTVGIIEDGRIREYWFKSGTDSVNNLVLKSEGKSAYDIAVENGFDGTEEEWLASLKGDPGQDGNDGQDAVNPFKGWFNAVVTGEAGSRVITSETQNLPANPAVGNYAYVKTWEITGTAPDQIETPIVKIYECTTAGSWSDSGRTADTSNIQTFASSQEVNEVHIVNDLNTGGVDDVLSAEQGKHINLKINTIGHLVVSLFKKSVYKDGDVQDIVSALESIFVENLSYITAVYTQSGTVYNGQPLSDLKDNLVVTAYYNNDTSEVVTSYILSGNLTTGTSTITVSYGGATATFDVSVTSALIITFDSTEIKPGYTSSTTYTNSGSSWPYTGTNAKRCYTPAFTKTIVGGHRYRVTVNLAANPDNKTFWIDAQGYTQSALNKLNGNHSTMEHSKDRVTGGAVVLDANNQAEFTLPVYSFEGTTDPQYEVKVVRCNIGLNGDTSSDFPSNVAFTSIVIEQIE